LRLAVVGHVEWCTFARVPRLPGQGAIVHATDVWEEAAGGGGVAAVQLARLNGSCELFTATSVTAAGALTALGVTVHFVERPLRRAFVHTDGDGERTITVLGDRVVPHGDDPLPWERLAQCDAVYYTGGDAAAATHARAARLMVATPRAHDSAGAVEIDALVMSGNDADESAWAASLRARRTFYTDGERGGRWVGGDLSGGEWAAAPLPGPAVDAYGCGDSFAAGLTFALARGDAVEDALAFAAACGAACLTGRGPYGATLPRP
jgi:ribokinase